MSTSKPVFRLERIICLSYLLYESDMTPIYCRDYKSKDFIKNNFETIYVTEGSDFV